MIDELRERYLRGEIGLIEYLELVIARAKEAANG